MIKNKEKTMVSVIMPTTGERDRTEVVKRVRNQSYKNIELIVVEDKKRKGAPWARNMGVAKAKGDYLFWLDDDIMLELKGIEILVEALDNNPDKSWAYGDFVKDNKKIIQGELDYQKILERNVISGVALVRKNKWPGWDEEIARLQDWDAWLTMIENGHKPIYVNKTIFSTKTQKGISFKSTEDYLCSWLSVAKKHSLPINGVPELFNLIITEKKEQLADRHKHINILEKRLKDKSKEIEKLESQLTLIKNSRFWKLRNVTARALKRESV